MILSPEATRCFVRDYETGQGCAGQPAASSQSQHDHLTGYSGGRGGSLAKVSDIFIYFSSSLHLPFRVNLMITSLKEDGLEPRTLLGNLEYVQEALNHLLFLKNE